MKLTTKVMCIIGICWGKKFFDEKLKFLKTFNPWKKEHLFIKTLQLWYLHE